MAIKYHSLWVGLSSLGSTMVVRLAREVRPVRRTIRRTSGVYGVCYTYCALMWIHVKHARTRAMAISYSACFFGMDVGYEYSYLYVLRYQSRMVTG
ncbi:hypothetical protein EDC01DRAFT_656140, partial [Geopyxis carbonaria]